MPVDMPLTVPAFADAIERLLDELGLGAVDIVGHSFGGWHALELGCRQRARRIVAIAPAGGWSQAEGADIERRFATRFIPRARRSLPLVPVVARTRAGRHLMFADAGGRAAQLRPADAVALMTALGRWPLAARIHEFLADDDGHYRTAAELAVVDGPVLLLWGRRDKIVPLHQAEHFTASLPRVDLVELPGVGHFPHLDAPDSIADAILAFVSRARTPPTG
jgi:pimeloyl-ACP methyl ester carboxylesterase